MSLNKFLLTVSTAALLAGPALADGGPMAEPPPPPPPPPPAEEPAPPPPAYSSHDWTGAYIGVQFGYAWGTADHTFANFAPSGDSEPEGFLGGVHVGLQRQDGSFVYGLEGDFDYMDVDGEFIDFSGAGSSGAAEFDYQGTLRLRLGYAVDLALLYITGGAAFAHVDYAGGPSGPPDAPGPFCCGFSDTTLGWIVGGGGEYAFTDSLSARVEYRYTDYQSKNAGLPPLYPGVEMTVDMSSHTVYGGLSLHF